MDQARSTISKIFNGEPHSYTRFNLTQNMEGDNSQVEMKLSSDMDEEAGGNGVGDHLNHNSNRKPHAAEKPGRKPKNLCFMVAATVLIFVIGYLIAYLAHGKKDVAPTCESACRMRVEAKGHLFFCFVFSSRCDSSSPREFSVVNHKAGSKGDESLANKVLGKFKGYGMNTWTDEHFIKVQDAPAAGANRFVFKGSAEYSKGFLSYSANGTATGGVLYAFYGQESDFQLLRDRNINMTDRVMLIRAGRISFAEKVANAAKMGASAVLIYPDPTDYPIGDSTQLFGHVHMGSGDPYTPGFPSFNHTQFPPVQSSGLPKILAQSITSAMASNIRRQLGGHNEPETWGGSYKLGEENDAITVEVNNVLAEKKIHNVFGVIKGFVDADRYVVIGAQRDAWGAGFATSTVGTSLLVELARSISDMVKNDGFKPRRSIVFASWSAGEYGSVGATEWLEVRRIYPTVLFWISSFYGIVTLFGVQTLPDVFFSMPRVKYPDSSSTLYSQFAKINFESNVLEPFKLDAAAYPFLAFSGIPSVSFGFTSGNLEYPYFGTELDTREKLNVAAGNQVPQLAETAARFAGHMVLRLVHDHLLRMDVMKYNNIIRNHVVQINTKVYSMQPQLLPKALTVQWLISASGSYGRVAQRLVTDMQNSDLEDIEMCRIINDRIMAVERNLLSPYVSPRDSPFRHIMLGSGPHTLKALSNHLDGLKNDHPESDADLFRNQLAMATWTVQGCANSLAGDIWALDNEI
uniref:Transferrin receptor protein 1 n=1 Tax=Gasterosteus aculeatus aculeatus TaxID=481459 RepID=A0AAQ4R427_GASAC